MYHGAGAVRSHCRPDLPGASTLRQLIRNVLLLLLQHPLTVVAVTAMHFIPFWLIYAHLEWVESLEGIFLLFGPGGIAYVNALMLVPVFRSYIPEEQQEA